MSGIKKRDGIGLIEIVFAMAIFSLLVTSVLGLFKLGEENARVAGSRSRAVFLAEEGLEAVRNMRDENFSNLTDGTFGLVASGTTWSLFGSSDATDIFTRTVSISSASTTTKLVTSTITWSSTGQRSGIISLVSYLTDWRRVGIANWTSMSIESGISYPGVQAGNGVVASGTLAYFIRSGGNPEFTIIDFTTTTAPITLGQTTINGGSTGVALSGSKAFVVSTNNSQEFSSVDVVTPTAPIVIGMYDALGNNNANAVFASGTRAYFTRASSNGAGQNEFYILDVSNPNIPVLLGSLNLEDTANKLIVRGNYAYIASSDNTREFQVVDVSVPTSPTRVAAIDLPGTTDAIPVAIAGNYVFVGKTSGAIYIYDITNPVIPFSVGSFTPGSSISSLVVFNNDSYLAVGSNDALAELKIYDISTIVSPTLLGSLNIPGSFAVTGMTYSMIKDRLLLAGPAVGANNNFQFVIVKPQ